jgi:hypothetical protein
VVGNVAGGYGGRRLLRHGAAEHAFAQQFGAGLAVIERLCQHQRAMRGQRRRAGISGVAGLGSTMSSAAARLVVGQQDFHQVGNAAAGPGPGPQRCQAGLVHIHYQDARLLGVGGAQAQ